MGGVPHCRSIATQIADAILFQSTGPLSGVFSLATLLPSLSAGVRRLHDVDRSGWWLLLLLVPLIGTIVLVIWCIGQPTVGSNRFGPQPAQSGAAGGL